MANQVKEILMKRDGMTEKDAEETMAICREELYSGNFDVMMDVLGLEDDYIFDLI